MSYLIGVLRSCLENFFAVRVSQGEALFADWRFSTTA
jgi:hypothetical protein